MRLLVILTRIPKLDEVPGFMERKNPSPALLRRAPSPLGEGCHFWCALELGKPPSPLGRRLSSLVRVEARKTALSLGERVARCRRFHQPERAG